MNHTEEIFSMIFISNRQSSKVMQPSEETFDFPTAFIAPQFASILSFGLLPALSPLWTREQALLQDLDAGGPGEGEVEVGALVQRSSSAVLAATRRALATRYHALLGPDLTDLPGGPQAGSKRVCLFVGRAIQGNCIRKPHSAPR